MGDSLEPGARVLVEVEYRGELRGLAEVLIAGSTATRFWMEPSRILPLSRPLPDPELREKIAPTEIEIFDALKEAFTKRNSVLDGHTTLCDCSYCLARTATNAVLGVLGVDGSAETGKQ